MGLAQTYHNVTSIFSYNYHGYQPLNPLRGVTQVGQSKGSRLTRKLLLAAFLIVSVSVLSFLVSLLGCNLGGEHSLTSICARSITLAMQAIGHLYGRGSSGLQRQRYTCWYRRPAPTAIYARSWSALAYLAIPPRP